jgi:endo-1,4-beta-xylanase
LKLLLRDHIEKVAGKYAGKMHSWDVVNEVIEPNDKRPDGLRRKPWLDPIGPDYIDMAFHVAQEADPNAILVWNENHLEINDKWGEAKRAALIGNLREMLKRKVPIQAIGLQSHVLGNGPSFRNDEFQTFLRTIVDLGLKIVVTEMDVTEDSLPTEITRRDAGVGSVCFDYLSTVLQQKSVIAVLTWGLSDRYSWLAKYKPRKDRTGVRPLPFDDDMHPTPAWASIARAFDQAPAR